MSRRYPRYHRRRHLGIDAALVAVLIGVFLFTWVWSIAVHVGVLAVTVTAVGGACWAGRRWKRRTRKAPAGKLPDAAGRVAELEQLAGRPIEAIIAGYRHIQGKYGGRP